MERGFLLPTPTYCSSGAGCHTEPGLLASWSTENLLALMRGTSAGEIKILFGI